MRSCSFAGSVDLHAAPVFQIADHSSVPATITASLVPYASSSPVRVLDTQTLFNKQPPPMARVRSTHAWTFSTISISTA